LGDQNGIPYVVYQSKVNLKPALSSSGKPRKEIERPAIADHMRITQALDRRDTDARDA
jgi:hypothetical protein